VPARPAPGRRVRPKATAVNAPVCAALERPSLIDFPGRIAAVLFVSGCNFRCGFCHNAAALARPRPGFSWERLDALCRRFRDEWADGAVVSGGEPTLDPGLPALVDFLRERGFAVKLDTNGSRPDVLERLLGRLDCVAMDVKCRPESYPRVVGFDGIDALRLSAELIRARVPDHEFRTTVVETIHSDVEMDGIAGFVRGARRYVLQPFLPRPDLPDPSLREAPRTSPLRLQALRERMRGCADEVLIRGG